jgi:uncharacterized protein (UPF0332 family)
VFDWDGFLALAEELAARPQDEAARRSAISRAYYATFHAGREYLLRAGIPVHRGHFAHLQVKDELRKRSEKIADEVERLQSWRKEADYDDPCTFDIEVQAVITVDLARRTIETIRSLS